MPAKGKKCIFSKNSSPLLFLLKFRLSKRKRMKSVLIIASSLVVLSAQGKTAGPADSLKISKDISLDEVVVTATKVAKGTPVAYSELTKDELNRRNDGPRHPLPDPPIAVRHHDIRCRDRHRLFRIPHPGDGCPTVSTSRSTAYR